MRIHTSESLTAPQKKQVLEMWNAEFPLGLKYETMRDFEQFLSGLGNIRYYFIEQDHQLIAWLATFDRDGERWFSMLIHTSCQEQGLGSQLLYAAKENEPVLNGWVVDGHNFTKQSGLPYLAPVGFYLKNGFELLADERLEIPALSAVKIRWRKH